MTITAPKKLTIATRQSPLALWQANFVKDQLASLYPDTKIDLLELITKGDKILDAPLAKIGGKGLFVKELETALLSGKADLAVHSLKDVPMVLPEGLILGAYLERHSPTDAFVSNGYASIEALPSGAVLGTSSLRRECQIRARFSHLVVKSLRGNVGTRLSKLDADDYDAIVLATSGLERLGLSGRIRHELDTALCLPAVGQGILAIECRDDHIAALIRPLNHVTTQLCAIAERAMNHGLNGGCQVPIAGFASLDGQMLILEGRVGTPDGAQMLVSTCQASLPDMADAPSIANIQTANALGERLAKSLIDQGADRILAQVYGDTP